MNQPDSPEFTEILNRVPRWHMLTPGVDVWRKGDEYTYYLAYGKYEKVKPAYVGKKVDSSFGRRPIPENVRRSEAWFQLLADVCREHSGNPDYTLVLYACLSQGATISGIFGPDLAGKLGTDDDCEQFMEEGPGAYMRWILTDSKEVSR
jgi:hypothetical protein